MKIVYLSKCETVKPKKLTKKQEIALGAALMRRKWEYRDKIKAEKEYPKYLAEARKKLNQ